MSLLKAWLVDKLWSKGLLECNGLFNWNHLDNIFDSFFYLFVIHLALLYHDWHLWNIPLLHKQQRIFLIYLVLIDAVKLLSRVSPSLILNDFITTCSTSMSVEKLVHYRLYRICTEMLPNYWFLLFRFPWYYSVFSVTKEVKCETIVKLSIPPPKLK